MNENNTKITNELIEKFDYLFALEKDFDEDIDKCYYKYISRYTLSKYGDNDHLAIGNDEQEFFLKCEDNPNYENVKKEPQTWNFHAHNQDDCGEYSTKEDAFKEYLTREEENYGLEDFVNNLADCIPTWLQKILDKREISNSFVAIDFETATPQKHACAVAAVKVVNNKIVDAYYSLIDPELEKDEWGYHQMKVHRISPKHVEGKPKFDEAWGEVLKLSEGSEFFAAHSASFDESVMRKCCERYGVEPPIIKFKCSRELATKWLHAKTATLDAICEELGIELEHHVALSDAVACSRIIMTYYNYKNGKKYKHELSTEEQKIIDDNYFKFEPASLSDLPLKNEGDPATLKQKSFLLSLGAPEEEVKKITKGEARKKIPYYIELNEEEKKRKKAEAERKKKEKQQKREQEIREKVEKYLLTNPLTEKEKEELLNKLINGNAILREETCLYCHKEFWIDGYSQRRYCNSDCRKAGSKAKREANAKAMAKAK